MQLAGIGCALVVTTYWLIVIAKLMITGRTIGKLPNVVPREPMGLALRLIWVPVIAMWVVFPWLVAHGNHHFLPLDALWFTSFSALDNSIVASFGFLVSLGALLLTLWCWHVMGQSWRVGIDPNERTSLVTTGPFSIVLHPIYSLSLLLMIGTLCVFPMPLILAIGSLHILLLILEAIREERFMLMKYPEEYPLYSAQVGRFIPKWHRQ